MYIAPKARTYLQNDQGFYSYKVPNMATRFMAFLVQSV